ncbi:MAG: protoporphyrinogen oxidase HemJ [Rhodospirillales bacterium]|nr:protoporphyrinogen oxidase HemJ [Rhodospirillales bacterium]
MDAYLWMKALHVISIIAWMAGLFYLPRLYVYHTQTAVGSDASETFKVMERKLLRIIMNPAMIASIVTGIILIWQVFIDALVSEGWLHAKVALVVVLIAFHMMLARWRRAFATDNNVHSEKFYRMVNEVPTVLMIGIVILVIVKPF